MREPENIRQLLAEVQPDYMGLIFYKKSGRFAPEKLHGIEEIGFPKAIQRVGVFVNETTEVILQYAEKYGFKIVQLHGAESPEQCEELKAKGFEVWKVFGIKDDFDFDRLQPYESVVDKFLFDTKGEQHGGNGYPFNWEILKDYPSEKPFWLSGGIGPESVEALKNFSYPQLFGVDVNSRFEVEAGLKNISAVQNFKEALNHG